MTPLIQKIIALSDGKRTSTEIAAACECFPGYVRKTVRRHQLPRPKEGAQPGSRNHQFVCGRRIDPSGYAMVTAPPNHPYARQRTNRKTKLIMEHRLVMEDVLGRHILPTEVVDHTDGLTLHNAPENLRLFANNAEHLRATITGKPHRVSVSGQRNIRERFAQRADFAPVDTHLLLLRQGDVRLRAILLAALSLGIDSPYLLGTHYFLAQAQIDFSSRPTIERALATLDLKWQSILAL